MSVRLTRQSLTVTIKGLLDRHPHLEEDDRALVSEVYAAIYPYRYDFHQFLYGLKSGEIPSERDIMQIKNQIKSNEKSI
jgi:hypothetical protein